MPSTIRQVLHETITRFHAAHIDSPSLTARLLLAHALGLSREWLTAHDDIVLDDSAAARIDAHAARVLAHEPLAYILGHREFYGIDLLVDARVLIPRPETEMLVDLALEYLRARIYTSPSTAALVDVIDVGTGSGAIAIAIARHAPNARIDASDISREALDLARENAQRSEVSEYICFVQSDLLDGVDGCARVIVANLPYVTVEEIEALPLEIQEHEPRVALDGGADGLVLVRRLLAQLNAHLVPGGMAVFEFGASQGHAALDAAAQYLPGWHCELRRDLAGLDRVLLVYKPLTL